MDKMIYGLFFGDSITYGEYDGVFGGWVDILKRYALQKYNERSNELILFNLGIGGETTEGLLNRMSHEMKARNSADGNIIFIGYGANDLAKKDGNQLVNPEQFKTNIETAVQELNGLKKIKIHLKKETALVHYNEEQLSSEAIINKITEAGYQAEVI